MSSSVLVSNHIRTFIRYIDGLYDEFKRTNPTATYDDFEKFLKHMELPLKGTHTNMIETKKNAFSTGKDIMYNLGDLITKIALVEENNKTIRKERLKTLNGTISGITILFIAVILVIVGVCITIYKASKNDYWALAQRMLMMVIVCVVFIGLYAFFIMYINDQKYAVKVQDDMEKTSIDAYKFFMYQSQGTQGIVSERPEFERVMVFAKQQNGMNEANKKKLIDQVRKNGLGKYSEEVLGDMDKLVASQWPSIRIVVNNVYNKGSWISNLNDVETSATTTKVFQGINSILAPYYDLMLKSRQIPEDDAIGKSGVQKIIDRYVIDDMLQTDLFGLDETAKRMRDDVLIQNMEGGVHYQMLMRGMYNFCTYFYPVFQNTRYAKYVLLAQDSPTLSAAEKSKIRKDIAEDPVLGKVLEAYPVTRDNYKTEQEMARSATATDAYKTVVDAFITHSTTSFSTINTTKNETYMLEMNNTPPISETKNLMIKYAKEFTPYFTVLVNNLIVNELSLLNPRSTQYFIFKPSYIREKLESMFTSSPVLSKMNPDFKGVIISIIVDNVMSEQKATFITNYYDFSHDSSDTKSLRLLAIEKKKNDMVAKIASNMSKFNISLAANSKYIIDKMATDENNLSSVVANAVETMISDIDHQVNTLKAANTKTLYENNEDMRFVEAYDFIEALDKKQFNTLQTSLRIADLKRLVNAIGENNYLVFHDREFSVKQGRLVFGTTVALIALGFVYYGLQSYRKMNKNGSLEVMSNDMLFTVAKIGIPFSGALMFLAIFRSNIVKAEVQIEFDKGRIKDNTEAIKDNISKLNNLITELEQRVSEVKRNKAIGEIDVITEADKTRMYDLIKAIMISYDKCNYIIGASKGKMPFPYAEVLSDGIMAAVIVGVIGYVFYEFAPITRVTELKEIIEYRQAAMTLVNDPSFIQQMISVIKAHDVDVERIVWTNKAIGIIGLIVFMLVYTGKITGATAIYKSGLYNSAFMLNSQCCDKKL